MTPGSNTSNTIRRLAWVTDIHLDCLEQEAIQTFANQLGEACPDALLIGGDIGNAQSFTGYLEQLLAILPCPIYFVLGNHDYYHGSIAAVRQTAAQLSQEHRHLYWLPASGIVRLTADSCLVGHGCWADGRLGDYSQSTVFLNDYRYIEELNGLEAAQRLQLLNQLGDDAADYLYAQLHGALQYFQHVYVLTHVPPYREACLYQGEIADDNWLPHFSCHSSGNVFLELMNQHPESHLTVLCGHTHHQATVQVLPNFVVKTGQASYGTPELQEILQVS